MKNETIKTIFFSLVLVILFSFWNIKMAEAKTLDDSKDDVREEILWLARVIYSETKKADEQVLVAWVVRNRVETGYLGDSYKEVATYRNQFSGLNTFDGQYLHNITRSHKSSGDSWENALEIAEAVYSAPSFLRPFPKTVRHFYSPISAKVEPKWATGSKPVLVVRDNSQKNVRFAFYDEIK
jgi:spore germination cell wall hydrolase CwlJ-like protein